MRLIAVLLILMCLSNMVTSLGLLMVLNSVIKLAEWICSPVNLGLEMLKLPKM
jgi:hypothetical protein